MNKTSKYKPKAGGWYPLPMPKDEETRKAYIELIKSEIESGIKSIELFEKIFKIVLIISVFIIIFNIVI